MPEDSSSTSPMASPLIRPYIILMVGVNGTGKTTTIGKLAHRYRTQGMKVLLAAADTFRAAAIEQLEIWAKRADADVVRHQMGADPASVAFDSLNAARARGIDVLIIDLQDVGTRVFTFASTMLNCLKAASNSGRKVLILDRPNPLGGETLEGHLLRRELYSFVGPFSLPMRHGLTMAEMARIFNHVFEYEVDLDIVTMSGWSRNMAWQDTDLKWIMPSPNMPLPETTHVYPGQVIWEGTNLSEGRGTCRPFEVFGAPFLDLKLIKQSLLPKTTAGCYLQEISFRPAFQKWKGELCSGFMIHILDHRTYRPYFTTIALLKAIIEIHRKDFQWKEPPYEYEYEKMPIDMILGDSNLRREIETGEGLITIEENGLQS